MGNAAITPITMPKWGLSMQEGKVVQWIAAVGSAVAPGDQLLDIETEKIANTFEALEAGLLRRQVAQAEDVLPIGALLGVMAPESVTEAEVEAFITEFQANYVPPPPSEEEGGPSFQWANVGPGKIRYAKLGERGPAVILIHGFGGDLINWLFTQEPLAASAQVFALDLPGHGQSSKTVTDATIPGLAATLVEFMDALEIERAHLIGHSLGGAIALHIGISNPERVSSLSLLASAGLGPEINGGYLSGFIKGESRRDMKPVLQQLVANPALITRQLIDDVLKFKRTDGVPAALRAIAAGFVAADRQLVELRPSLAALPMPVQVLWGSRDQIISASHAEGLPANVHVERLEGVGHLLQMEAASQVNTLLKRFIL
ncbi:MAG: acetoin dehydrogenase dihydrolipoyllysine-residue acetyltransferase subunit [Gammaproteobacteria bacterium]